LYAELTVSYRSLRRRVEQFARTLDAPAIDFVGPVEIDEVYVTADTSMKTCTSTPARATRRCCDGGSRHIEASLKTSSRRI
jgi:hypothetical protein